MRLRQFPPDVIRDVVVRFVERVPDEVFNAHNSAFATFVATKNLGDDKIDETILRALSIELWLPFYRQPPGLEPGPHSYM